MKCQFCNERCRLLKKDEPDFNQHEMTWLCPKHPTRVLHHVRVEKYCLRRDHSVYGIEREWERTSVRWVTDKGQLMVAWFCRDENRGPTNFIVYQIKKGKEYWQDKYNEIFSLDEHPKDFTPENVPQKIATLTIFS